MDHVKYFVQFYIERSLCSFKFDETEFFGKESTKKLMDSLKCKAREAGFVLKNRGRFILDQDVTASAQLK